MSLPTPRQLVTPRATRALPRRTDVAPADESTFVRETAFESAGTRIHAAVASACGLLHAANEDAHSALDSSAPLFVVADGVGGGAMAAQVSRELVRRLHASLEGSRASSATIGSVLIAADRAIQRSIASETAASGAATVALCSGMGSSLSRWLIAWVGDCRVYRIRATHEQPAELLTVDDTYRHLHEQPPQGGSLDDPARMVGNGAIDAPNVRSVSLRADDMLVLCSDGIHKHADAGDIARLLREGAPLARRCAGLVALARERGGHDDATVLVVERRAHEGAPLARLLSFVALAAFVGGVLLWLALNQSTTPSQVPDIIPAQSVVPSGAHS